MLSIFFNMILIATLFIASAMSASSSVVVVNVGHNATLPCFNGTSDGRSASDVCWRWSGIAQPGHQLVQKADGSLLLLNVTLETSDTYTCSSQNDDTIYASYKVLVPGPPPGPTNLTATEIDNNVILKWINSYTDDYLHAAPDTVLRVHYRPIIQHQGNSSVHQYRSEPRQHWRVLPHALRPTMKMVVIRDVKESFSYQFELWAENKHGPSPLATVTTTTKRFSSALHSRDIEEWEHQSQILLVAVVSVLAVFNLVGGIIWLLYCERDTKRKRRRHRAIGNHSGLSRECEQLELVCHAHEGTNDGSSLTLPHHAALV